MHKLSTSSVALLALVAQLAQPLAGAQASGFSSDDLIRQTIQDATEQVQVFGVSPEQASIDFATKMSERTSSEIMHYIYTEGSAADREIFAASLDANNQIKNRASLMSALTAISESKQTKVGSNFHLSCGAGLGIGIPLILAGIIVGVIGLTNSRDESNQAKKEYADQAKKLSDDFDTNNANLISSRDSTFKDENEIKVQIAKIKEQVALNSACAPTPARYGDLMASYDAELLRLHQKRELLNTEIATNQSAYDAKLGLINTAESAAVADAKSKSNHGETLAIAGGVATLVSLPFLIAGFDSCDTGGGGGKGAPRHH